MIEDWEVRRAFRYVYDKLSELDKRISELERGASKIDPLVEMLNKLEEKSRNR